MYYNEFCFGFCLEVCVVTAEIKEANLPTPVKESVTPTITVAAPKKITSVVKGFEVVKPKTEFCKLTKVLKCLLLFYFIFYVKFKHRVNFKKCK